MGLIFPNDVSNLLDGPVRALRAPFATARPDDISDIINMVTPYAPKAGWIDFGATTDAAGYSRDMSSEEYTIEQETGAVLSKITETNRSMTLPIAEITPENMKLIEEGIQSAIASGANTGAQVKVGFGSIESLTKHRIAFIAQRDPGFGDVVIEPGGGTRGPFVALVGYAVTLAAEGSSLEIAKGSLVNREVTFTLFPDSTVTDSRENTGAFLFETAGTIVAV